MNNDRLPEKVERALLAVGHDHPSCDLPPRECLLCLRLRAAIREALDEVGITNTAIELAAAWMRYTELFGEPPHGTEKQMAALLELVKR